MKKVMIVYGTRPECIKLYPVIEALKSYKHIKVVLVNTGQQRELSDSFTKQFKLKPQYNLAIMKTYQSLNHIVSEVTKLLNIITDNEEPDLVLVQGDTTTAMSSALAAFNNKIPVGHVEAGLRTHDTSPYPEEMNRSLITQLADYHFCPAEGNFWNVRDVHKGNAWITGNTSIDVVKSIKPKIVERDYKQILLTLHRRENIESGKAFDYLDILHGFALDWNNEEDTKVRIKWVTHPNSSLVQQMQESFESLEHFDIVKPLPYNEFINYCYNSDLILSDSGGCQEECAVIKTPLWILRQDTERPEIFQLPVTIRKLVKEPVSLHDLLETFFSIKQNKIKPFKNPFGDGKSGERIAKIIATKILK